MVGNYSQKDQCEEVANTGLFLVFVLYMNGKGSEDSGLRIV